MTDTVIVALITTFGSVIVGLGAAAIAMMNRLTTKVDGRLTQLLDLTSKASHAEGMKEELDKSNPEVLP
jgi:hypothetical protein